MLQVIQNYNTGELTIEEVASPALQPGGILVRNAFSVISAGTERSTIETAQKSLIGKAQSRPDLVRKVLEVAKRDGIMSTIQLVRNKLDTPVALGYSTAGIVIAVAPDVEGFAVGDRVACAGQGYASHAEIVYVPRHLAAKVPDGVGLDEAAYTTLGAIALQGVRQAETSVGDIVAVVGLGLLGLLTVQLLKAAGCTVVGVDINADSCRTASRLGADTTLTTAESYMPLVEKVTNGHGVDSVVITAGTSTNEPILFAGEILRNKGKLVVVGAVPVDVPRSPFYEKEIDIRFSRSYGPGRYDPTYEEKGVDYPYGYVRWTENRNMESFLRLIAQKKIDTNSISTHRFKIEDASSAYDLITGKRPSKERSIGILLEYAHRPPETSGVIANLRSNMSPLANDRLPIGFVGAGNYAQSTLLPILKKMKNVALAGVVTSRGITSNNVAKKFKFQFAASDAKDILQNKDIPAIFVATRHHQHAAFVADALRNGKAVFVEKPLAVDLRQLEDVIEVHRRHPGKVVTGFNRRFAPSIAETKKFFARRIQPAVVQYRINAGFVPKEHWTQDPVEGGGRIIGEVCHFVDLISFLLDSMPIRVFADLVSSTRDDVVAKDNVTITLRYRDGSLGSVSYIACGDKSVPKERIEMFAENSVAIVDDFKKVTLTRNGRSKTFGASKQNKGHALLLSSFVQSVLAGTESPVSFGDAVNATKITFSILDSLSTGLPVDLHLDERQEILEGLSRAYTETMIQDKS